MRKYPRLDKVQAKIVEDLLARGYSVISLAAVGNGCPDILVGLGGAYNVPIELKTPGKATKPRTAAAQAKFRDEWQGCTYQANSTAAVLACLQDAVRRARAG